MRRKLDGFADYPPFYGVDLDALHQRTFTDLGIKPLHRTRIEALTAPLAHTHPVREQHWRHSIRVSQLCRRIGEHIALEPKMLWYPGVLHDVGKALIPIDVLGKTSGWSEQDAQVMSRHVMYGYHLVRDIFPFSAQVMVRHHQHQENSYPKRLPPCTFPRQGTIRPTIARCGRILALADSFDAFHRIHQSEDGRPPKTGEEIYTAMLNRNQDIADLVQELYTVGIFSKEIETARSSETVHHSTNPNLET